jgi:tripartite-type tricarboxylate transporter receptor subunit TctC
MDQVGSGQMKMLLQNGLERSADFPELPNSFDLLRSQEDRDLLMLIEGPWAFGRPLMAPPSVPSERMAALRQAFDAMIRDADFLAEAEKDKLDMHPMSWEPVAKLVAAINDTPPGAVRIAREILEPGGAR